MGSTEARLLQIVKDLADGKPTNFAKNAGIPPSTFQYYIKGRMPHGDHLKRICEFYNVNINWLLTGEGTPYIKKDEPVKSTPVAPKQKEHQGLVLNFIDQDRGFEANKALVELEKLDRDLFIETIGELKERLKAVKRYGKPSEMGVLKAGQSGNTRQK